MSTKTVPTVYQQCTNRQNSQKIVNTAKMTIGVPIVTGLPRLYQQYTSSVPVVKNTQKTSQNSNNDRWCTNCHMSTQSAVYQQCTSRQKHSKDKSKQQQWSLVYQLSHVYTKCRIHKSASTSTEYTKPMTPAYQRRLSVDCYTSVIQCRRFTRRNNNIIVKQQPPYWISKNVSIYGLDEDCRYLHQIWWTCISYIMNNYNQAFSLPTCTRLP